MQVETEIGFLSDVNVGYLVSQRVLVQIDDSWGIRAGSTRFNDSEFPIYSAFRWVVENVMEVTGFRNINKAISIMRTGYTGKYSKVLSIPHKAFELWGIAQSSNKRSKARYSDF